MTKKEAIEKAYGEHWEAVKDYVDENGWFNRNNFKGRLIFNYHDLETEGNYYRPKSLQGLETNRGWIKIEDTEQIIPEDPDKLYFVGTMFESGFEQRGGVLSHSGLLSVLEYEKHTHYQPIQKPQPPIY